MADILVHHIDDALAAGADFLFIVVYRADPVQCLLRWRNVVAMASEYDDRRLDLAQVDRSAPGQRRCALLEPVADEQILDDPADLSLIHEVEARPPAFEAGEALRFGIGVDIQVEILSPP